jgi:transcriptional antiterminator RfaH
MVYLPRHRRQRRHARRVENVAAPLFPRYLFVRVDMATQRWRAIFSTIGVSRLVCNGEQQAPVPDAVITQLRTCEDSDGFIRLTLRPQWQVGETLRISDGVFRDCLGLYEGMTDGERVAVLLDLLGRRVRVVMNADSVVAA